MINILVWFKMCENDSLTNLVSNMTTKMCENDSLTNLVSNMTTKMFAFEPFTLNSVFLKVLNSPE